MYDLPNGGDVAKQDALVFDFRPFRTASKVTAGFPAIGEKGERRLTVGVCDFDPIGVNELDRKSNPCSPNIGSNRAARKSGATVLHVHEFDPLGGRVGC